MSLIASVLGIALFAHQYGVTCAKCHTVIPHLTAFGTRFMASGDRIPGVSAGPALPFSAKVNLAYSSAASEGLPKAVVDEVELLTGGTIGTRGSFYGEQYAVDGGEPGNLREAWISERLNPWNARIPLYVQGGRFTLPLPVDPETFRETAQHYAVYDEPIGDSGFTLFDPGNGAKVTVGDALRGLSAQFFTGSGSMFYVADSMGPVTAGIYRYARAGASRTGYSIVFDRGKWTSETLLEGWNGGFTQLRYAFDRRLFAIARYEGVDSVVALGFAPARNARVTIEDVVTTTPATSHTLNAQVTVGF